MTRFAVCFAVAVVATASPALACSCGPPDAKRALASSEVVFEGSVVEQRLGVDLAGKPAAVIRVRADRMVKGHRPKSGILTLYSAPEPAACGVDYTHGFSGRFGARLHTGGLYTSNCTQFELNLERYKR